MTERTLTDMAKAVQEYDGDEVADLAQRALDEGTEPGVILDTLTTCIREVGDAFGAGDLFLPELVGAADAMEAAMPIVEDALKAQGGSRSSAGKVVAGTVAGDIHNIGKSIFCTLLVADGYEVIDLGIDVKVEEFMDAVEEQKPDVVAMSALLTITAQEQQNVIAALASSGLREGLKVIVGGGAISQRFADTIGADGYSATAPGGVSLVRDLLG
jgi:5-methyltetrahydrofolate--homocysteine methyltransferase